MCGFLFVEQLFGERIDINYFNKKVNEQNWRGPDSQHTLSVNNGSFLLGHNRLSILDLKERSNQPMRSQDGNYIILYNGEIYNHLKIRENMNIKFNTMSDTETIIEGFVQFGERIFELIDGMFALVILNCKTGQWIAARDAFGIKPLFIGFGKAGGAVLGSESSIVASVINSSTCASAIEEWKLIRRPVPGSSFFKEVKEVLPGTIWRNNGSVSMFWHLKPSEEQFNQEKFEMLLKENIDNHQISDVGNVSLLSGGLDSSIITALSSVKRSYCVGMPNNNEFDGAKETSMVLSRELQLVTISPEMLKKTWQELTLLRKEPLSLPNEGLIYAVCKAMQTDEKVVLTGEGADELLFGYDKIYRWAVRSEWKGVENFLSHYGYSDSIKATDRLNEFIEKLREGKKNIDFVEDFFYQVHLTGLLRRMDFASMAASKEARVPFVSKSLVSYMYRRCSKVKLSDTHSKIPLRKLAEKLGLFGALKRGKVGFNAQIRKRSTFKAEYLMFQKTILETLKW